MQYKHLRERARSLKKLTPLDTQIAECFSRHYDEIVFVNVTSVSHNKGANKTTVVRFISKFGYNNFGELRRKPQQDILTHVNSDDILFAVFRHLYVKQTSFIVQHCADQGVPVILLSDSEFSPLADLAQVKFIVASEEFSLFQSCTLVSDVLETLHIAALRFCDDSVYDRFSFTENLYKDFKVFYSGKYLNKMSSSYAKALAKPTRDRKKITH